MFGYIVTNPSALPEDRQRRFRAMYCGLCRTLRARHGLAGSATLSYDLTFLAVLLNALYEPGEQAGEERCPARPVKRHHFVTSPVMDYVAAMIHKRRPAFSMIHISFVINVIVAGISYFVYDFKVEPVILCIVYSYLTTRVGDYILKGGKEALRVEMITAHPHEITDHIVRELHHSSTIVQAEGGYSHQGKTMLICVINKHQITKFTEIISQYPDTFACVSTVSETLGNFRRDVH